MPGEKVTLLSTDSANINDADGLHNISAEYLQSLNPIVSLFTSRINDWYAGYALQKYWFSKRIFVTAFDWPWCILVSIYLGFVWATNHTCVDVLIEIIPWFYSFNIKKKYVTYAHKKAISCKIIHLYFHTQVSRPIAQTCRNWLAASAIYAWLAICRTIKGGFSLSAAAILFAREYSHDKQYCLSKAFT